MFGRKNWDISMYFPPLYHVTQKLQLLLMFGHFCSYVEIISLLLHVNKENGLGRKVTCSLNLNVLWNFSSFWWTIIINTTIGFEIHNSLGTRIFSIPKLLYIQSMFTILQRPIILLRFGRNMLLERPFFKNSKLP